MTLTELAQNAGAGPQITEYLEARGIRTTPTLALISNDRKTFLAQIVQPLLDGYQKGTTRIALEEEEKPIAQAVMEHMWREAQLQWQRRQAVLPLPPPGMTAGAPTPMPGPSNAASAPAVEKPPKQLPSQVWQKQISRYNNVTVDGRPRKFPEKEVLGAESVLGRIYHEHVVTRSYTPVALGEILQKRSFTASGEVNPLQKQTKASHLLRVEDDVIVQDEDCKTWTPKSVLSVMDGVNSIRWAWILLQIGEEDHIHGYADWFIQKIRARPNKLENMRMVWEAAGWRLAMGMRSGQSFGEVATEVMADVDLLNESMSKELPKETKPVPPKKRPANDDPAPPYTRQRTTQTWSQGYNSKGSKGNQKGRPSYNSYGGSNKWKTTSWGSTQGHDGSQGQDGPAGR